MKSHKKLVVICEKYRFVLIFRYEFVSVFMDYDFLDWASGSDIHAVIAALDVSSPDSSAADNFIHSLFSSAATSSIRSNAVHFTLMNS